MSPALVAKMQAIDERNLARLVVIINQYGWPGKSLVGLRGSSTALLIIQHADPDSQRKYLPLLQKAAAQGELEKSAAALLEDQVLMGQHEPQIYGNQLMAKWIPKNTRPYRGRSPCG